MQHIVHAPAGLLAVIERADIAFDELEVGPLRGADQCLHFVRVAQVPFLLEQPQGYRFSFNRCDRAKKHFRRLAG